MDEPGAEVALRVNWTVQPFGDGWEDLEADAVVWVDVARVERSFALDPDHYVGPGGTLAGQATRYANIGRHIESGLAIWMPHLSLRDDDQVHFTDGRHRFAWVRDHGGTALPVATSPERAARLAALFGSTESTCEIVAAEPPGPAT